MKDFYVRPGQEVSFSKTVGEADVYMFAGITGDLSSNHVNEQVIVTGEDPEIGENLSLRRERRRVLTHAGQQALHVVAAADRVAEAHAK